MSDAPQPGHVHPDDITIGRMVVTPQPNQVAFPLTKDKFDLLQQGMVSEEKQGRDVTAGVFFTALIGILPMMLISDWKNPVHVILVSSMGIIAASSGVCCLFFWRKCKKSPHSPGCARVKAEIEAHFNPNQEESPQLPAR